MEIKDNLRKKELFLKQVETLNTFLNNGAITKEQYDISYNGLVTKMKITNEKELLNELDKGRESGNKEGWLTIEESKRLSGV